MACTVRLRDPRGRPLSDAIIAVTEAATPVPELGYVTGMDGSVQIGLPPGCVTLDVLLVSGARHHVSLWVERGAARVMTVSFDSHGGQRVTSVLDGSSL